MSSLADCDELDQVVLATVAEPDNEPLRQRAGQKGWDCFWYPGEVDDVVGRLVAAAEAYEADICLLISADCPLTYGPAVDHLVCQLRNQPDADYLRYPGREEGKVLLLEGVHVARRRAWEAADELSNRPELREHQFPVIYQNPDRFHAAGAFAEDRVYGLRHRMSVDTWADLEFMETLNAHLTAGGLPFNLPNAVALLAEKPELREINGHVHQRALVEHPRQVLFVVDVGGAFGFGHFMRCRELAGQIVERLGWPVTFVVDDMRAAEMADACGFRVCWGALGRNVALPAGPSSTPILSGQESCTNLVIVDLSITRSLSEGWRAERFNDAYVVVIDREDSMALESDLIVHPGVNGRAASDRVGFPPVLEGLNFVIIRREISRYQDLVSQKSIDLLAYLHDRKQREQIERLGEIRGWCVQVLDGIKDDFPELMARSKVFLSGYGQSFYEAVALNTYPLAMPISDAHRDDALTFYRDTEIPPYCLKSLDDLSNLDLRQLLRTAFPVMVDGTSAIVKAISEKVP